VGAAIAAGSHLVKGACALLVKVKKKKATLKIKQLPFIRENFV
jgi:hypothetical protein